MRLALVVSLGLIVAGCGAGVQFGGGTRNQGGMISDEIMAEPDGLHSVYIDRPNFSRDDPMFWNQPSPSSAVLPATEAPPPEEER